MNYMYILYIRYGKDEYLSHIILVITIIKERTDVNEGEI